MKHYLEKNVYAAAKERIAATFKEFPRVYVSFSGGKDSGVLLHMALTEARRRKRRLGVLFVDLEAFYQLTIDYIKATIEDNLDTIDPYWICLPMESPNSPSYLEPTWVWWDSSKRDIWVRPMPEMPYVINETNNPFDFYKQNMPFEQFIKFFADWYGGGKPCASLVGIRTDESLNRFHAISNRKRQYKGLCYSTGNGRNSWNFYPLYDWRTEDLWTYYARFRKPYNKLYDLFYKAGISIHKMRVDEPFGNEAKSGLKMFKIIEPETWGKVVNRVSGANFGNIYGGNKIMCARYKLPSNHTWKSFTKFLLTTMPPETAANYRTKFIKFIRYWHRTGCPIRPELLTKLEENYPDAIINTHKFSRRGTGDKEVIKFKKILDEAPGVDNKDDILSWRRMAMCIVKNDFVCKSLSFSITKNLTRRQKELMEKYRRI